LKEQIGKLAARGDEMRRWLMEKKWGKKKKKKKKGKFFFPSGFGIRHASNLKVWEMALID